MTKSKPFQMSEDLYTSIAVKLSLAHFRIRLVTTALIGVGAIVIGSFMRDVPLAAGIVIGAGLLGLLMAVFSGYDYRTIHRAFAKSSKNRSFFESRTVSFDDEFLAVDCSNGSAGRYPWTSLVELWLEKDYAVLFVSAHQFVYVPYDALESGDDLNRFKDHCRNAEQHIRQHVR